jgi:hypothetical protein
VERLFWGIEQAANEAKIGLLGDLDIYKQERHIEPG